ncbi:plant basic secretory protein [Cyathus striatus]|nr:plant basic secretory protein [Cyathus striatus]
MPPLRPVPPGKSLPIPRFDLRVEDLEHEGAIIFFQAVNPLGALKQAVISVLEWLYTPDTIPTNVESIVLILRPMDGVAYTCGSDHDPVRHKEIHFSLNHIRNSSKRARDEIMGVLTHEVVHCYQYNAKNTCPGGLIEGIADFIRLRANLAPPHWKRKGGSKWDAGYDTTGFFLDWIETRYGNGAVVELNAHMKDRKYRKRVFKELTGRSVKKLWNLYCIELEQQGIITEKRVFSVSSEIIHKYLPTYLCPLS